MSKNLNEDSINTLTNLLKRLTPGKLPLPIFLETSRLNVNPIVEVVPLRRYKGETEVLLTKREASDPIWPGMYHTPGTVVRATDTDRDYKDAFKRILKGELSGVKTSAPVFIYSLLHKSKRGTESALIFWVEVLGKPKIGKFFRTKSLPKNIVDTQIEFIERCVNDFKKR